MSAVAWMSGALLSFSLMAVGARELSEALPVPQTLFFRSFIGLTFLVGLFLLSGRGVRLHLRSQRVPAHVFRNVFHFAGQFGWFVGIGLLPLAEVFALEFTVPIWTLLIATLALREKLTVAKGVAVMLGLCGVLVIVQPGYAILNPASFVVLGSAICYAVSHTTTKSLSRTESATSILFFMCLVQLPLAFCLSLSSWVWPVGQQWLWLFIIGITALSAHFCMARAMQKADVSIVVILDFLRLPLIALVGVLFYAEPLAASLVIGGLMMLVGNLVSLRGHVTARPTMSHSIKKGKVKSSQV